MEEERSASQRRTDTGRSRPAREDIDGKEFRHWRTYDEVLGHWRVSVDSDKRKVPHAYVLQYAWLIAFEPNNATESKNLLDVPTLQRHCKRFQSDTITISAVKYFAEFECFLLKRLPRNEYTKYIVKVKEQIEAFNRGSFRQADIVPADTPDEELKDGQVRRLKWMKPDSGTVIDWCNYLHAPKNKTVEFDGESIAGRNNNWGTLGLKLSAISAISLLFGGPKLNRKEGALASEIKRWKRGHYSSKKSAPSFLIPDLPAASARCLHEQSSEEGRD